ncbi:hypothetical protein T12_14110 [Trichinella patagoniensis]|uniref:Uncharacterized protein n=1 Tax=Trichinella patagoniensis TaxID=990121 RepID=A0A0V0YTA0_9BILA|nr:hypothetical protein T12_14110 [Trichinella patagoniensis]
MLADDDNQFFLIWNDQHVVIIVIQQLQLECLINSDVGLL